jgi:hypothetical protein
MKEIHQKRQKVRNLYKLQRDNITKENECYTRVINTTNTHFTEDEIQLLNKGLKYNLHYKPYSCLETTISNPDIREQQYYRHAVTKNI